MEIKIIKSCNQNWNEMSVVDNCRFCRICEKKVFDFTNLSSKEILRNLKGKREVCSKISLKQIQDINSSKIKSDNYSPKWALVLSIGAVLGISSPMISQVPNQKVEIQKEPKNTIKEAIVNDNTIIKGQVLSDEDNLALPGVTIKLKDSDYETYSNLDGEFRIEIPKDTILTKNILRFEMLGMISKEVKLSENIDDFKIRLTYDPDFQEEVIIVGGISAQKNNIFRRIGRFFTKLFGGKTCN